MFQKRHVLLDDKAAAQDEWHDSPKGLRAMVTWSDSEAESVSEGESTSDGVEMSGNGSTTDDSSEDGDESSGEESDEDDSTEDGSTEDGSNGQTRGHEGKVSTGPLMNGSQTGQSILCSRKTLATG